MDQEAGRQVAGPDLDDTAFDAHYFANCCGRPYRRDEHWLNFFGVIAESIATTIQPRRVLDAGCAMGLLVEALRARGIDAHGVDLSSYAIANVYEPVRPYCSQASITEEFSGHYDLIVSIEVLEHMPPREGEAAIANCCRHTDDVLFSSTPSDFREPTHVNVQPPEYWAELFARHGFYRDVDFDASFVTPWAGRFRRSAEPLSRIVRSYERELTARRAALEETQAQLTRKTVEADARIASLEHDLADARSTIQNMERSVFWRLRGVWARISRLTGRPT